MKPETGKEWKTEQRVGRIFGPGDEMKVLAKAWRDEQRNELVWVFCRDCLTLKVVRWANLNRNKSCGCGRDENVRQHAGAAIGRVPWPLKLQIWAAAQGKISTTSLWERFADDLRPYKLQKHERDQLVRSVFTELEQAQESLLWSGDQANEVIRLRHEIENSIDRDQYRRGELDRVEFVQHRDGTISGLYRLHIKAAERIRERLMFLLLVDKNVEAGLRRCRFNLAHDLKLAEWLLNTVQHTQEQRKKRNKRSAERATAAETAAKFKSRTIDEPDQDLVEASWSPPSVDAAD